VWWALLTLALVLPSLSAVPAATIESTREYKLKAGFLFNFAKFVEWPKKADADAKSPLVIGVFADDPAAGIIKTALEANPLVANGRPVICRFLSATATPPECEILFMSRAKEEKIDEILAQTQGQPILTVGEVDQFAQRGGMINFVRKDDYFRFEVNLEAAEKVGLKMSGNLASMATIVKRRK
jgi:hypothetical protein